MRPYSLIAVILLVFFACCCRADGESPEAIPDEYADALEKLNSPSEEIRLEGIDGLAAMGDRILPVLKRYLVEAGKDESLAYLPDVLAGIDSPAARAFLIEQLAGWRGDDRFYFTWRAIEVVRDLHYVEAASAFRGIAGAGGKSALNILSAKAEDALGAFSFEPADGGLKKTLSGANEKGSKQTFSRLWSYRGAEAVPGVTEWVLAFNGNKVDFQRVKSVIVPFGSFSAVARKDEVGFLSNPLLKSSTSKEKISDEELEAGYYLAESSARKEWTPAHWVWVHTANTASREAVKAWVKPELAPAAIPFDLRRYDYAEASARLLSARSTALEKAARFDGEIRIINVVSGATEGTGDGGAVLERLSIEFVTLTAKEFFELLAGKNEGAVEAERTVAVFGSAEFELDRCKALDLKRFVAAGGYVIASGTATAIVSVLAEGTAAVREDKSINLSSAEIVFSREERGGRLLAGIDNLPESRVLEGPAAVASILIVRPYTASVFARSAGDNGGAPVVLTWRFGRQDGAYEERGKLRIPGRLLYTACYLNQGDGTGPGRDIDSLVINFVLLKTYEYCMLSPTRKNER